MSIPRSTPTSSDCLATPERSPHGCCHPREQLGQPLKGNSHGIVNLDDSNILRAPIRLAPNLSEDQGPVLLLMFDITNILPHLHLSGQPACEFSYAKTHTGVSTSPTPSHINEPPMNMQYASPRSGRVACFIHWEANSRNLRFTRFCAQQKMVAWHVPILLERFTGQACMHRFSLRVSFIHTSFFIVTCIIAAD